MGSARTYGAFAPRTAAGPRRGVAALFSTRAHASLRRGHRAADRLLIAWPYPDVFAHRGGGALAPENTLAALDLAARLGQRAVEFDATLSADGIPFLLHDARIDRTSNGHGVASTLTYAELAQLDAGSWFGAEFAGERMPTLADALARCATLGLAANVEIKPAAGFEDETGRIVAARTRSLWRGEPLPLLSSFSTVALAAAQKAAPDLPRALLLEKVRPDWQSLAEQLGCISVHVNERAVDATLLDAVTAGGYAIMAYTVNEPARAKDLLAAGVAAVCTDRIDRILPR